MSGLDSVLIEVRFVCGALCAALSAVLCGLRFVLCDCGALAALCGCFILAHEGFRKVATAAS